MAFLPLFVVVLALQCSKHFANGVITDVRLTGGPTPDRGTVEIRQDNGTWETTCGINLSTQDVIIICRQLGFRGANRAISNTPFGQNSTLTVGLDCKGGENYLGCFEDRTLDRVFPGENLIDDPDMTISYCIQFCQNLLKDYVYAGVELGDECFCGEDSNNYARHGVGTDFDCQSRCSGDPFASCGGSGYIAVFSINVQSSTTPTVQANTSLERTTTGKVTTPTPRPSAMTTIRSGDPDSMANIGLYAGAAGGVVAIIIIVIVVIVLVIVMRKRSGKRKDQFHSHDMAIMQPASPNGGQDNLYHDIFQDNSDETPNGSQLPDPSAEGDVTYYSSVKDQQSAEGEDTYYSSVKDQKSTFKDSNPSTAMSSNQNDGLPQKDVVRRPPPNGDAGAMYAMPDKSGRKSQEEDFGALYAKPDKSGNSGQGSEDFGLLYALPDKSRGAPEGREDVTVGDLSATPDRPRLESQKDNGEGLFSLADDDTGLYAMSTAPGHTVNPDDNEYGTVMVDNELYAM